MALYSHARRILMRQTSLVTSLRPNGYIILVPELGDNLPEKNPLLNNDRMPQFNNVSIENCMATVAKQTLDFEKQVRDIESAISHKYPPEIDVDAEILEPLEEIGAQLDTTWGLAKTLYLGSGTKMPTKWYLSIHDRAKRARATKFNNRCIYTILKTRLEHEHKILGDEARRVWQKFVLEGKLNGLDLKSSDKASVDQNRAKLAQERSVFKQKVEIATDRFSHTIDEWPLVQNLPQEVLKKMAKDKSNPCNAPWTVSLLPDVYLPVLENCPDRGVRWNIWQALVSRGSGYGDRDLSTSLNLEEIRYLRRSIAKTLGYETYAHMSMETKMAGTVENVQSFLKNLLERSGPAQEREIKDLYDFAVEGGFKGNRMELWDIPYWRRKQQLVLFDYDEEQFRNFFPVPKVLEGLFNLCEKLFGIVIRERSKVSVWHKDVKFYDVFEPDRSDPVGGFYLDLYARSRDKYRMQYHNGWMVGIQNHSRIAETKPLAALIFDFDPPSGQEPSKLRFKEVKSLFHRFGLALQHLLTRTNYSEVAGSSNLEWDVVEVSGHLLSHWLLNKSTMDAISAHSGTGEPVPENMFQSLVNVHQHLTGFDLSRLLYLSALDMELHLSDDFWLDITKKLWSEYRGVFPLDKIDSHPCCFTQIFTEEWGAAYYSHVWSKMIAADCYSAFHEVRNDEQKVLDTGKRYRDTFLALGGSCPPAKVFRKFRGRDPSHKALLKSLGIRKVEDDSGQKQQQ